MNKKISLTRNIISILIIFTIFININSSSGIIERENDPRNHLLPLIKVNHNSEFPDNKPSNFYDVTNIIYSAHQVSSSRIYILQADGTIIRYYEYDNVRLLDFEVVNNEVYIVDSLSPSVYKINLSSGELVTIISDSSLNYLYNLAFDGTYFYAAESNLNRYDINGNKLDTASFNETVLGSAWDGVFYWTLNDNNQIQSWDISNWPLIAKGPYVTISAPSNNCKGLWFDGLYFLTAEGINDTLGRIYQFDYYGDIIDQWVEPAFVGWSACFIEVPNTPPKVLKPSGPLQGNLGLEYSCNISAIDPDGHQIYIMWDWDDGNISEWEGPYNSSATIEGNHKWILTGSYEIKGKAKDIYGAESNWSESFKVDIIGFGDINFLIGSISNFKEGPNSCTFNANKLIWWRSPPGEIKFYSSGEQLTIRSDYNGLAREKFIICIF